MQIDRFTFYNNSTVFAELGSEEEAKRLVQKWNNGASLSEKIRVRPIKRDFFWGETDKANNKTPYISRYFTPQGNAARDALRALDEGRRRMLSVQTPGWSPNTTVRAARENNLRIIEKLFSKYAVECISGLSPFYGGKQQKPRMLCSVDFKTKEDAENATRDIHDTVVEGQTTWLQPVEPAAWRTHQYAKFAPEYVAELQEKGVLTKETYENKFTNPVPKKNKANKSGLKKEQRE